MPDLVAYWSEQQYLDHMRPIVDALGLPCYVRTPKLLRGDVPAQTTVGRPPRDVTMLVASFQDLRAVRPRPAVMLNHGAGQTYLGDPSVKAHPSYTGGPDRDNVILNLCPSPSDADACMTSQPGVPAAAVGVPKLDAWHAGRRGDPQLKTVAVSWHWDNPLVPEARSAWPHYREQAVESLADAGWTVLGHAHPRMWSHLRRRYERCGGVEPVRDFADVLDRASLYVVDNSSTAAEFASCDRPVLLMNAPWYRRHVEHGRRFWDWTRWLPTVDGPADLPDAVAAAYWSGWSAQARAGRSLLMADTYLATDGRATARAVTAIERLV